MALLLAPLLLSSCFLLPGKFDSSLRIDAGGAFSFAYKGEIRFVVPDELARRQTNSEASFNETNQKCFGPPPASGGAARMPAAMLVEATTPGTITTLPVAPPPPVFVPSPAPKARPCTRDELAERRAEFDRMRASEQTRRKRESEQLGQLFGFDPTDESSMRAFAAQLQKQAGWRSVVYKGGGLFDVDYAIDSRLTHDFVFPIFPRGTTLQPFVIMRRRADGAVLVSAPGYVGTGPATMLGLINNMSGAHPASQQNFAAPDGRFTLTTSGEILTNNTEDGGSRTGGGTALVWQVSRTSDKVPEALIRPN